MPVDEKEYDEDLEFFVNFEGVSKRALNMIPKNTLIAMKKKIDDDFIPKDKIKEILRNFVKKETVDEKYMKISDVEKNYTLNDKIPDHEPYEPMEEPKTTVCQTCGANNFDFMYDHEKTKFILVHCIYCGADLHPPLPPKIIKRYESRPYKLKSEGRYESRPYKPKSEGRRYKVRTWKSGAND